MREPAYGPTFRYRSSDIPGQTPVKEEGVLQRAASAVQKAWSSLTKKGSK